MKKAISIAYLLRIAGCILWRCAIIIIRSKMVATQRLLINRLLHHGSIKIFKIAKATYAVRVEAPLSIERGTPIIFMSNHQSLFDPPLIYATMPGTIRILAKKELFQIPFFGGALEAAEYIAIDRTHLGQATEDIFPMIKKTLSSGISLWIFAEGKRALSDEVMPLKPGGFRLAREIGAVIVPVGIVGTRRMMPAKTFDLTLGCHVEIRVGKPIDAKLYSTLECQKKLMQKTQEAIRCLMNPETLICEKNNSLCSSL